MALQLALGLAWAGALVAGLRGGADWATAALLAGIGALLFPSALALHAPAGAGAGLAPSDAELTAGLLRRLDVAAATWAHHIETAQQQMRDACEALLGGFAQILEQLDAIAAAAGADGSTDHQARWLAACRSQLGELLGHFSTFVDSRQRITSTVRDLAGVTRSLRDMASDVDKIARQTNLVSLNATIEAARVGAAGRGFAVVAGEVRRLSTQSGETGHRIGQQVQALGEAMSSALQKAEHVAQADAAAVRQGEETINRVVAEVDDAVRRLQAQTTDLGARGERVREEVQQLMVAFQFQDRVHQILDQVHGSMGQALQTLRSELSAGRAPDEAAWNRVLTQGYSTEEQRATAVAASGRPDRSVPEASTAPATSETTFF